MDEIVIFGASNLGQIAYKVLKNLYKILFFVDNDQKKWGKELNEIEILAPTQLNEYAFDKVIIASTYYVEISNQLRKLNIKSIYLFSYQLNEYKSTNLNYKLDKICDINIYSNLQLNKKIKIKPLFNNNLYNKKNILIFAYLFPPIGGAGVQRTFKFVKYLYENGYNPTIVTVGNNFFNEEMDMTLLDDINKNIRIIRINHEKFNTEQLCRSDVEAVLQVLQEICGDKYIFKKFINAIERDRRFIMTPDNTIIWVSEIINKIHNIININEFKCVYTTSAPYSTHFIGYYLKKQCGVNWIADFRDEWTNNPYNVKDKIEKTLKYEVEYELEKSIMKTADKIIQVTPISTENCISTFNLKADKVATITNGFDEEDFDNIFVNNRGNSKFIVNFSGTMYRNMFPENFIKSFNELINEKLIDKELIQINIYGRQEQYIKNKIRIEDKYSIINCNGYIEHKQCLKLNAESNMLFLPIGEGEQFRAVYTGKVFEYIRLQIPILALAPVGGVVDSLLRSTDMGKVIEYKDKTMIKNFILLQYNKWKNNDLQQIGDINEIKKYDRKVLTNSLIDLINEI